MGMFKLFRDDGDYTPSSPNPKRFKVLQMEQVGAYCVLLVHYPDCLTYEGKKILVCEGDAEGISKRKELDPHFNSVDHWLLARFNPDRWDLAKRFVEGIANAL